MPFPPLTVPEQTLIARGHITQIYRLLAKNQLTLVTEFVPSRDNISDALSRGDIAAFLRGFPRATVRAHITLPPHLSDKLILL